MIKHYDFAGSHWRETKGYEAYQVGADMIREAGMETAARGYVDAQTLRHTRADHREVPRSAVDAVGDFMANLASSYAGLPYDKVHASMKLFGEKVVPELHKMRTKTPAAA